MAKRDTSWRDAVLAVLKDAGHAMHYTEIAEEIVKRGLRTSYGATPATTVNVSINNDIRELGENSTFVRVGAGEYVLREKLGEIPSTLAQGPTGEGAAIPEEEPLGIIQAFGMFWRRDLVLWKQTPALLGQQQVGATTVDFASQRGVYLLHDGRDVVYVGRAVEQLLGNRLFQHTADRLNGRWDRFSWFGFLPVSDKGEIQPETTSRTFSLGELVPGFEALLIEALEPPQNRKRGDDLRAVEYLQAEDPKFRAAKKRQLVEELLEKV
jgi:HB1, ASXL, restriction endonuclease HTH domain